LRTGAEYNRKHQLGGGTVLFGARSGSKKKKSWSKRFIRRGQREGKRVTFMESKPKGGRGTPELTMKRRLFSSRKEEGD